MTRFKGKVVLVLGGSRGIGAAIVRRFVEDGATVAFTYAGSRAAADALAEETGARAIQADSGNREALLKAVRGQAALDVLVINAGIYVGGDPLELDATAADRMIDVNIRAPYHAAVEAARRMPTGARIIVIGSTNGDRSPFAGVAAYGMTKSALQGMVRGLARDFGEREITVNAIQPGPTDTDMNPADGPFGDMMRSFMAIKRHVTAAEIAGMAAYLAGPEARSITGATLTIDGGFAA